VEEVPLDPVPEVVGVGCADVSISIDVEDFEVPTTDADEDPTAGVVAGAVDKATVK